MQFKRSVVLRVVITLYLSTDSWCYYLPDKEAQQSNRKSESPLQRDRIKICGNQLTTMIIEACDGIVGTLEQANLNRDSVQTKITEDCCDRECSLDYLQNFCGDIPLFTFKKTVRGRLLNLLGPQNWISKTENRVTNPVNYMKNSQTEVRINEKVHQKNGRNGKRGRKKRKRSFKWNGAFKSFGHYLLNLNWKDRRQNSINRTWPSIEIGTISPEIDKFGGQPIVVVKKNKRNSN